MSASAEVARRLEMYACAFDRAGIEYERDGGRHALLLADECERSAAQTRFIRQLAAEPGGMAWAEVAEAWADAARGVLWKVREGLNEWRAAR